MGLTILNSKDNFQKIESLSVPAIDIQIDDSREKLLQLLTLSKPLIIFPKTIETDEFNSSNSIPFSEEDLKDKEYINSINDTLTSRELYYSENQNSMLSDDFIINNAGIKTLDDIKIIAPLLGIDREEIVAYSFKSIQENWMILKLKLKDGSSAEIDINIIFPDRKKKRKLNINNPEDLILARKIKLKVLGGLFKKD